MRQLPAIIEGQRNLVTKFYQDHHENEWYIEAYEYLRERRSFVQKRFMQCTRYVDVHTENCKTFSYEFASIHRDCGSIFSSVLDAIIKGSAFTNGKRTTITDYKQFLKAQDKKLYLYSVHFRIGMPKTDELWTNIGSRYDEKSFDMNTMKRLFTTCTS